MRGETNVLISCSKFRFFYWFSILGRFYARFCLGWKWLQEQKLNVECVWDWILWRHNFEWMYDLGNEWYLFFVRWLMNRRKEEMIRLLHVNILVLFLCTDLEIEIFHFNATKRSSTFYGYFLFYFADQNDQKLGKKKTLKMQEIRLQLSYSHKFKMMSVCLCVSTFANVKWIKNAIEKTTHWMLTFFWGVCKCMSVFFLNYDYWNTKNWKI